MNIDDINVSVFSLKSTSITSDNVYFIIQVNEDIYTGYNSYTDEIKEFHKDEINFYKWKDVYHIFDSISKGNGCLSKISYHKYFYNKKIPTDIANHLKLSPNMTLDNFFKWFCDKYSIEIKPLRNPFGFRVAVNGVRQDITFELLTQAYEWIRDKMIESVYQNRLTFKITE